MTRKWIWEPSQEFVKNTNVYRFMRRLGRVQGYTVRYQMKNFKWITSTLVVLLMYKGLTVSAPGQQIPDWVNFPGARWATIKPEQAGLDLTKWNNYVARQRPRGEGYGGTKHPEGQWGAVIVRGGYILKTWGNPDYKYQTASLGKSFTKMVLTLAVDEGLIGSENDLIRNYWTGAGLLNGTHKYLDQGFHKTLTFKHLKDMMGGFPVSDGYSWNKGERDLAGGIPAWAKRTGDADYDNYSHCTPGKYYKYSSGGYWRLAQALTAVWNKDIKKVLDEKIMSKMGIPANAWDWIPGQAVHDNNYPGYDFYPDRPGYGLYLDPPYTAKGHVVRGGPGWVVMNAKQLARVGLLISTVGWWKGERLISEISGFNSVMGGTWGGGKGTYWAWGVVATKGIEFPPDDIFTRPITREP